MGDAHGGKSGLQGFFYGLEAGHVLYDHVGCEGVLGGADSPYVYVMDVAYTVFGCHCGLDLPGIDTLRGPVKHQTQAVFEYAPGGNEYKQGNCNADQRVDYIPAGEPYCNS